MVKTTCGACGGRGGKCSTCRGTGVVLSITAAEAKERRRK